jgi:hypothetical protein
MTAHSAQPNLAVASDRWLRPQPFRERTRAGRAASRTMLPATFSEGRAAAARRRRIPPLKVERAVAE